VSTDTPHMSAGYGNDLGREPAAGLPSHPPIYTVRDIRWGTGWSNRVRFVAVTPQLVQQLAAHVLASALSTWPERDGTMADIYVDEIENALRRGLGLEG
jgi:hypothetical protein